MKPVNLKLILCILLLPGFRLHAQVSQGGRPFPYDITRKHAREIILPPVNNETIISKATSGDVRSGKKPLVFAWNHELDIDPYSEGTWSHINGCNVWRVELVSKGAYAMNVYLGRFMLEKNCMLFAYSPDQVHVLGGFNDRNNLPSGDLNLAFIPGDRVVVELQVPDDVQHFGELRISSAGHDFINVFGRKNVHDNRFGLSDYCNIDINCSQGLEYQIVKRSVCRLTIRSGSLTSMCTGTLINTTHFDNRPYLITANHCIFSNTQASTAVFYFDYESEECNGSDDTTSVYSMTGSSILATSDSLDFTLLRLSSNVPVSYNPYFAGWTTSRLPATSAVCIHHPEGDVKKISIESDPLTASYQETDPPSWLFTESVRNGFWRVRHWEGGTTEGGSSGAPIFNQNKKIVGNLTGGDADCESSINDYFSKFFMEWNYYTEPSKQLKYWLDSLNTGLTEIPGSQPDGPDPIDYAERFTLFPNPADESITFETDSLDISDAIVSLYGINGTLLARYPVSGEKRLSMNVSFLAPGIYIFEFRNNNIHIRQKLLIMRQE